MPQFLLEVVAVSSLKRMYSLERGKGGTQLGSLRLLLSLLCRECIGWGEGKIKGGARRKRRLEISFFSRMSPEIFFLLPPGLKISVKRESERDRERLAAAGYNHNNVNINVNINR